MFSTKWARSSVVVAIGLYPIGRRSDPSRAHFVEKNCPEAIYTSGRRSDPYRSHMIAVLTGGNSSERTVALWSAETVVSALKSLKLNHTVIDCIDLDWLDQLKKSQPQLAILALHGRFGEDGQIQKILDREKIPYSGSGPMACRLAWNKIEAKRVVKGLDIPTPSWSMAGSKDPCPKLPVVVKPAEEGSSFGVTIVKSQNQIEPAINLAKKYGSEVLIEEFVDGTELTCGVIDLRGSVEPLPLVEIVSKNEFFDFAAKYDGKSSDEIVPARISQATADLIGRYSLLIFRAFGCRHYARVDWILRDQTPYFLELNTLPGLTKNSLIIKELQSSGISTEKFIQLLAEKTLF